MRFKIVELFGYTLGGMFLARYDDSPVGKLDEVCIILFSHKIILHFFIYNKINRLTQTYCIYIILNRLYCNKFENFVMKNAVFSPTYV